jgi:hypothetical protein
VFRIPRPEIWPNHIDLATVRETIEYMEDDMRRVPELQRVADALKIAKAEIEAAERKAKPARVSHRLAKFLPYRP